MARKLCNHPVFPSLRAKLAAVRVTVCPTCLLRLHVFEISEIQTLLEQRGGVFTSRATAVSEQEMQNKEEMRLHKALVKRWRLVKIALHKDLLLLEDLHSLGANKPRWEIQLDKALEFWEDLKIECSTMPGYKYSEEDDCLANEEKSDLRLDADFECRLNEGTRIYRNALNMA